MNPGIHDPLTPSPSLPKQNRIQGDSFLNCLDRQLRLAEVTIDDSHIVPGVFRICPDRSLVRRKRGRSLRADATYFELGLLSHNLMTAVKRLVLGGDWVTRTTASLRWQLIQIAGKVVRHGRRLILRVQERHYDLRSSIRQKLTAMAAVATPT